MTKHFLHTWTIVAIVLFTAHIAHAQIGKKYLDQAKDRVNQRIEQKIEQKIMHKVERSVDKALQELLFGDFGGGKADTSTRQPATPNGGGFDFGAMLSGEKLTDVYEFDTKIQWRVQIDQANDADDRDMEYWQYLPSAHKGFMATEIQGNYGIMDFDKMRMITLIEEGKMAMVMKITPEEDSIHPNSDFNIQQTGKTKSIAGYLCHQYIWADKEGNKGESWITTQLGVAMRDVFATNGRRTATSMPDSKALNGFPLQTIVVSPDQQTTTLTAQKVEKQAFKIELANYTNVLVKEK